jgi:hypothetical protein
LPIELPNWKRILKGKTEKKMETKKFAYFIPGWFYYCEPGVGVLYCGGGLLPPCEYYIIIIIYLIFFIYSIFYISNLYIKIFYFDLYKLCFKYIKI